MNARQTIPLTYIMQILAVLLAAWSAHNIAADIRARNMPLAIVAGVTLAVNIAVFYVNHRVRKNIRGQGE